MTIDRRTFVAAAGALSAAPAIAQRRGGPRAFPRNFLWGVSTAGHQIEGNNVASDTWFLENVKPTIFAEKSGDACNSLALWPQDLDIVKALGLNSYRFSVEWARIEPEQGLISNAMLDHYRRVVDGCIARGLTPVVTYSHFTAPRWFSAAGGWTNPQAPTMFARFCERVTRHLGRGIGHAVTMNEPNLLRLLRSLGLPPQMLEAQRAMLVAAAKAAGAPKFVAANAANAEDSETMQRIMLAGHKAGRDAIKSVRPDLPVGVSLAMLDDQAVGAATKRDAVRADLYDEWLDAARGDDFIGVQNYERARWGANGRVDPPADAVHNWGGAEVWAPSLAGAVRYAHQATGKPVLVTEHGVGSDDDAIRARLIPESLAALKTAMDDGVPVHGYLHWSLLDNFEWIFGYKPRFGLVSVDRTTFKRTLKPSASVLGAIAKRNAL